jgi:hypothetical protein
MSDPRPAARPAPDASAGEGDYPALLEAAAVSLDAYVTYMRRLGDDTSAFLASVMEHEAAALRALAVALDDVAPALESAAELFDWYGTNNTVSPRLRTLLAALTRPPEILR